MQFYSHSERLDYTGSQLCSHFALESFGLYGDSIVCFKGACRVEGGRLVDLEDRLAGDTIRAALMLHYIVEHFGMPLDGIVVRQRLLVALTGELLAARLAGGPEGSSSSDVCRRGDDIFVGERKATVSIASVSPVSGMIHLGINIDPEGAPVEAWGLARGGIDPDEFAGALGEAYVAEMEGITRAAAKVRPLRTANP